MSRVALIPTGRMEWEALPAALAALFPGHQFFPAPAEAERLSKPDMEFPISSFTSCDVRSLAGRANNADKLIRRAAVEAMKTRAGDRVDLVVILDDLELDNVAWPSEVTRAVRLAAQRHVQALQEDTRLLIRHPGIAADTAAALREKVSFHLAKPMIEAWLFADPRGPQRAGVTQPVLLKPGADPEDFEACDDAFIAATDADCAAWNALAEATSRQAKKKNGLRPIWAKQGPERVHHPKAYLAWLLRDAAERRCTRYQETTGGADALSRLDWRAVLAGDDPRMPFLRALVNDLAEGLGQAPAIGAVQGAEAPETSRRSLPQRPLLRNL